MDEERELLRFDLLFFLRLLKPTAMKCQESLMNRAQRTKRPPMKRNLITVREEPLCAVGRV